jgi:TRAP-type mannitol/chloroaromatic compound transport system permease large subunit
MIFLILLGATTFALVFRGLEGDTLLVSWITQSGLSAYGFVIVLLLVVFIAGFFIDFIEIIFIVVPVALPLVQAYEIDPVWLAVLLAINLQTSFLTPPFGFSLFYLRGVVPDSIGTQTIYRGIVPYVLIQACVVIFFFWTGS